MLEKINKITEEQVQKMIFYGLAILMFVLPVPQFFLPESERVIGIQCTILTMSLLYFGMLLLIEGRSQRITWRTCGLATKCMFGLMLVGIISLLISEDKEAALYGVELRWEGLVSLVSYYCIFLISKRLWKREYCNKLICLFLVLGCIVTIVGVIQYTGIYVFGDRFPGMAYVPMRNPNFYGGFAVLFTGVGIGGFFSYKKESDTTQPFSWWNRIVWYVIVLLGYTACICARSVLVYTGLIMLFLMYLFLEIATKRREMLPLVALILGLIVMIFLFDLGSGGGVTAEIKTVGNQIKEEGTIFGDRVGTGRMSIWKQTISMLPKYGLFGCGIEQLGHHYFEGYLGRDIPKFDKAHNEYLNLWITEGFFALIIYLVFLFSLFIPGMKLFLEKKQDVAGDEKGDMISKIAFFAFFGYIAQAFFNISVIQVAPYFWMMCGLLYYGKRNIYEEAVDS